MNFLNNKKPDQTASYLLINRQVKWKGCYINELAA